MGSDVSPRNPNAADRRVQAVRALAQLGSGDLVDGLLDPDPGVRRVAAPALPDLGEENAVRSLQSLLGQCEEDAQKREVISALTEVRYGRLIDQLIQFTREGYPDKMRQSAVEVLAQ